jgi:hypothetical protein
LLISDVKWGLICIAHEIQRTAYIGIGCEFWGVVAAVPNSSCMSAYVEYEGIGILKHDDKIMEANSKDINLSHKIYIELEK